MTIKKPRIRPTTNRFLNNFLEIALVFIIISIMGLVAYNKIGFYIIHPIFYLMTTIMGLGWLLTAIVIIFESKSIVMGKLRFSDIAGMAMFIFSLCICEVSFIAGLLFLLLSLAYVVKEIVLKPQWKKTIVKSITF